MSLNSFQKYISNADQRQKFKKQCLKGKNILFENDQLQIGCKIIPLYDFYSSLNYLQINLFVGNKTDQILDSFTVDFRGTNNLELFFEEKNRSIKERTQYKQRIIVGCNNYEEQILLLMDFQSSLLTLKSSPVPITLFNFCIFNSGESIPASLQTESDLQQFLQHKYEFTEQANVIINPIFLKKGIKVQIQKYLPNLVKICDGVYIGHFSTRTLINEYTITIKIIQEGVMVVGLSSDEYNLFQYLFNNIKFLFE